MSGERYSVELTRQAEKDLRRLRSLEQIAIEHLLRLEENPYLGHTLTGSLRGYRSLEFSGPGGAYRAAYGVVPEEHVCIVFMVGPHENFYREAERRARAMEKRRAL